MDLPHVLVPTTRSSIAFRAMHATKALVVILAIFKQLLIYGWRFNSKTRRQMFLLPYGSHVCALRGAYGVTITKLYKSG